MANLKAQIMRRNMEIHRRADCFDELVESLKFTKKTLGDAAVRGTRAKPTVAELNNILDVVQAALTRAEGL